MMVRGRSRLLLQLIVVVCCVAGRCHNGALAGVAAAATVAADGSSKRELPLLVTTSGFQIDASGSRQAAAGHNAEAGGYVAYDDDLTEEEASAEDVAYDNIMSVGAGGGTSSVTRDAKHADYLNWLQENGINIDAVSVAHKPGRGNVVVASQKIPAGSRVATIPVDMAFRADLAWESPIIGPMLRKAAKHTPGVARHALLLLFVYEAYYNHSPGGSFWKPWFDIMPGNFDGVGAVYDEEDHQLLQRILPTAAMHGGVLLAGLQEAYDMLLPIMHEYPQVWGGKGEGAEAAMEESLIMGFATLMTHLCTYGSSDEEAVLLPLIDTMNYSPEASCITADYTVNGSDTVVYAGPFDSDTIEGSTAAGVAGGVIDVVNFVLFASTDLEPGSEVTANYMCTRRVCNHNLLMKYGFVVPNRDMDCSTMVTTVQTQTPPTAWNLKQWDLLRDNNLLSQGLVQSLPSKHRPGVVRFVADLRLEQGADVLPQWLRNVYRIAAAQPRDARALRRALKFGTSASPANERAAANMLRRQLRQSETTLRENLSAAKGLGLLPPERRRWTLNQRLMMRVVDGAVFIHKLARAEAKAWEASSEVVQQ